MYLRFNVRSFAKDINKNHVLHFSPFLKDNFYRNGTTSSGNIRSEQGQDTITAFKNADSIDVPHLVEIRGPNLTCVERLDTRRYSSKSVFRHRRLESHCSSYGKSSTVQNCSSTETTKSVTSSTLNKTTMNVLKGHPCSLVSCNQEKFNQTSLRQGLKNKYNNPPLVQTSSISSSW